MLKREYETMFAQEEKNWYFKGKRAVVFGYLAKTFKKNSAKILDVGCGTGITLLELSKLGNAFGIDASKEALGFCEQRGLKNISLGSIEKLPFEDSAFDLITCLDVLYHKGVKSDSLALKELFRVAKKGSMLIITESALMQLWSEHDQAVQAKKRYSKKELLKLLKQNGFTPIKASYWNFFIFPVVFMLKKLSPPKKNPSEAKSNVLELPKIINFLLFKIICLESFMLKFIDFPLGVDLFIVAKK